MELLEFAKKGDVLGAVNILHDDVDPNYIPDDKYGWSSLYVAAKEGHLDMVNLLLDWNADVDIKTNHGLSPLFVATSNARIDIVKLLLQRGANVDIEDNSGSTPLYAAIFHDYVEELDVLLRHRAALDHTNNNGWTPLYHAAVHGRAEIVELLLYLGADDTIADGEGRTPFDVSTDDVRKVFENFGEKREFKDEHHFIVNNNTESSTTALIGESATPGGYERWEQGSHQKIINKAMKDKKERAVDILIDR